MHYGLSNPENTVIPLYPIKVAYMPIYEYKCENCSHRFEIRQSFKDEPLTICQECSHESLVRVIGVPRAIVYGGGQTVGQVADYNTRKLGRYELEAKRREQLIREGVNPDVKPEKGPDLSLAKMSPEKQKHYIMTGER